MGHGQTDNSLIEPKMLNSIKYFALKLKMIGFCLNPKLKRKLKGIESPGKVKECPKRDN